MVDDVPANLEVITETLAAAGYSVAASSSGDRAIKRLQHRLPALILLDLQMPGIDGFEICRRIKADACTAHVPVIFLTAQSDTESIVQGFAVGAIDYISKPIRELEVLSRVRNHLELHHLRQSLEQRVAEQTQQLAAAMDQIQTTLNELQNSQVQLVQQEKMATLGGLVAGVAHEINNPLGFLNGSVKNSKVYVQDLLDYIQIYQTHQPPVAAPVLEKASEIDLDFVMADFPVLLGSMERAMNRIKAISNSLRTFSRSDTDKTACINLHEAIDSAVVILKYRLKAHAQRPTIAVIKQYTDLPPIECFAGQLNQALMNILANAIDVFDEMAQQNSAVLVHTPPQITISTALLRNQNAVEIRIRDNGYGMDMAMQQKIFDYLFTTKAVGKGTGLGLAIVQRIIVEVHGGQLSVDSAPGQGSEFRIQLPLLVATSTPQ